ncbi:MAG: hypothetical protein M3534_15355, partial [Actinomycetota bacterium]|nr:hypothetical protein [Actinomycetota bacterium]
GAVKLFQFDQLLGGEIGDAYGFHGLLLHPHLTPLGIYLFVLSTTAREEGQKEEVLAVFRELAGESRSQGEVREYVPWQPLW